MMQVGILIHMTSDELQGSQYSFVKEKAVNFLDDWARLPDQVAMDVGCCGHYKEIMTTTIRRKSVLSLRTCCATGARGTGTGQATVPPQPRGLGKTKVSRVTARERAVTTVAKVRGPRVTGMLGSSKHHTGSSQGGSTAACPSSFGVVSLSLCLGGVVNPPLSCGCCIYPSSCRVVQPSFSFPLAIGLLSWRRAAPCHEKKGGRRPTRTPRRKVNPNPLSSLEWYCLSSLLVGFPPPLFPLLPSPLPLSLPSPFPPPSPSRFSSPPLPSLAECC